MQVQDSLVERLRNLRISELHGKRNGFSVVKLQHSGDTTLKLSACWREIDWGGVTGKAKARGGGSERGGEKG